MTTTDPSTIPSHLSEKTFRLYEPYLLHALRSWPEDSPHTVPDHLATTTFVARFRDSILSILKFRWDSPINIPLLLEIGKLYTIAPDAVNSRIVWFRRKVRPGAPVTGAGMRQGMLNETGVPFPARPIATTPTIAWPNVSEGEFLALLLLVNNDRLSGPILLAGEMDMKDVQYYPNTAVHYDKEKNVTVVT